MPDPLISVLATIGAVVPILAIAAAVWVALIRRRHRDRNR